MYLELGTFADARERAESIAMEITGIDDPSAAVSAAAGLSDAEIAERSYLTSVRAALPNQVLAVGFYHTVGLKKDGTVVAAGLNDDGQCDVDAWRNVVAVDAGAYHTVGLKKDGTVVATGSNEYGQCDVGEWDGVVAVACSDYDTVALLSNGTLISTGYHTYETMSGWKDVRAIGAGSYLVVAVRQNGKMLATHSSAQDDSFSDLIAVDASTAYAVGLLTDGTVMHTFLDLSDWRNVVAVSAASTATFGLTADGTVLCHYFRASDALDFSDVTGAVAIAAGGTHTAVLCADGSVQTRGDNACGQCNTEFWSLGSYDIP